LVLAHPSVPANNLPELFAYAKANPDKVAVATDGARRFSGMVAAWLNKLAGTNISYVPYTQMTQGIQDVLAGRVQLVIIAVPAAKGHVAAGKLRPLAVTSLKRLPEFPDVAAVAETFPGFDFAGWFALAAPTGVPAPIIARVHKELNAILQDPAVSGKLKTMGFVPYGGGTLEQTHAYVQAQHKAWGTLVHEIGLKPE
jgi:tripartite-type tricarboxylate transporter receptor subunit TctC